MKKRNPLKKRWENKIRKIYQCALCSGEQSFFPIIVHVDQMFHIWATRGHYSLSADAQQSRRKVKKYGGGARWNTRPLEETGFTSIPHTELQSFLRQTAKWSLDLPCRPRNLRLGFFWMHSAVKFKVSDCALLQKIQILRFLITGPLPILQFTLNIFNGLDICLLLWSHSVLASHSAYVPMSNELHGVKIDGFLYPNFI